VTRLGRVVAVRRFRQARTRRAVTIRIGQPRRSGRDWFAPVEIRGLGPPQTDRIYGIDALQAFLLSVEFLRIRLSTVEPPLTWLGGAPGDLGLPTQLPHFGVPDLSRRLDRLMTAEMERWARGLERKYRRRRRRAR
jgi:hypothetical protein